MTRLSTRWFAALALALAVGLAFAVSPHASSSPDGLERVAGDSGFEERGTLHRVQQSSPVPDYAVPGIDDPRLATGLAGFLGTMGVAAAATGLAAALRHRQHRT